MKMEETDIQERDGGKLLWKRVKCDRRKFEVAWYGKRDSKERRIENMEARKIYGWKLCDGILVSEEKERRDRWEKYRRRER